MDGTGDTLGTGAGGMNNPFSPDDLRIHGGRGVSEIKAVQFPAVALTDEDRFRIAGPPGECVLNSADGTDFPGAHGEQPALQGEGAEHINDDHQAFRLPGALNKMIDPDLHNLILTEDECFYSSYQVTGVQSKPGENASCWVFHETHYNFAFFSYR